MIHVRGVVQGVGFRPFIYRLALRHRLSGWVRNTSGAVEIEAEGQDAEVRAFVRDIAAQAPTAARIEETRVEFIPSRGEHGFVILDSLPREGQYQLVSPDLATCPDCLREILDPADRRYRYPFTNCTNCGPRFTIIGDIPYDRPLTTMRDFTMCPACQREYDDPADRRFHAQPNACPTCGPQLQLLASDGRPVPTKDALSEAARLLREGRILAVRGLGGFQLACDATNAATVALLRDRKRRPAKPFAVMLATLDNLKSHCRVSDIEVQLLASPAAPIVLTLWSKETSSIVPVVAPGLGHLGVMLPYTPLHHLLLREASIPLVMTSGNLSEEPIAKDNDEALASLRDIADYFLVHDRGIQARYDDSVFMVEDKKPVAVRRARGYAPYPVRLPYESRQVLACGAELKNTFCLTRDRHAFVSQHIGDMENEETLEHYERTVQLYERLFRVQPEVIACDLHPEYLPSKYAAALAEERKLPLVKVQHHHAHIVSCLTDNGVTGPVIGVAFDGVGFGTDGAVWGGEFLVADRKQYRRAGQLEYVPMPGGAAAIKKPYRMAFGYIRQLLGGVDARTAALLHLDPIEAAVLERQVEQKVNCPLTSSAGRLFDAVAAIVDVRREIDYEAQAAIELEMLASVDPETGRLAVYPYQIDSRDGYHTVRLGDLFRAVIEQAGGGLPVPEISLTLHNTVAQMAVEMCSLIARDTGLKQVALSGGVFQNRLLLRLIRRQLEQAGFGVLTHRLVPCNDGGISLGQAVVAHFTQGG